MRVEDILRKVKTQSRLAKVSILFMAYVTVESFSMFSFIIDLRPPFLMIVSITELVIFFIAVCIVIIIVVRYFLMLERFIKILLVRYDFN